MGCAMKANLLAAWRHHFVLEDHMLEVKFYFFQNYYQDIVISFKFHGW